MKNILITAFVFLSWAGFQNPVMAQDTAAKADNGSGHRIVIGFTQNDTNQFKAFLNQLTNLTTEWPMAQIEVVTYNQGLDLLLSSNKMVSAKVQSLAAKGVQFAACAKTMEKRKISQEQLIPQAFVVRAAIPEIVLKQEAGWSYIVGGF